MIGRQGSGEQVDLGGVARDDQLLDLLGSRLEVSEDLRDDPVVRLLRALTADVDAGLAELMDRPVPARVVRGSASLPGAAPTEPGGQVLPLARRHSARAGALALVVGAALSIGGVSAAVTGDPLAGYRAIAGAAGLVDDAGQPDGSGQSSRSAEAHRLGRQLDEASAQVAAHAPGAAGLVERLEARLRDADLSEQQRLALARALARLKERLAAQAGGRDNGAEPRGGQGSSTDERDTQGGTGSGKGGGKHSSTRPGSETTSDATTSGRSGGTQSDQSDQSDQSGQTDGSKPAEDPADSPDTPDSGDAVAPSVGSGKSTSKGRTAGTGTQPTSDASGGGTSRR